MDEYLAELAHHYGRSANVDVAVQYLTSAVKQKMDEAMRLEQGSNDSPSSMISVSRLRESADTVAGQIIRAAQARRADKAQTGIESVESIWRYPVKSMAGEELSAANVSLRGLLGDRLYAVINPVSNRTANVRSWAAALLNYRARFVAEPEPDAPAPDLRITLPDGFTIAASDPDIHERLSAGFDRKLRLVSTAPAGLSVELPAGTLSGSMSNVTEVPIGIGAPPGAFFDYGCVHLIATSTLHHLQSLYPQGRFDVRRFRPNIVVRSQESPFIENSWIGRMVAIGGEVVLRITIPCVRCVTMIMPQFDLPHDPGILRTVAQHNMQDLGDFGVLPCAGVYADVVQPGAIRRGDTMHYLD